MSTHLQQLQWIDAQQNRMVDLVTRWAQINSGTYNVDGVAKLSRDVEAEFAALGCAVHRHDLPPTELVDSRGSIVTSPLAQALRFVKRPEAPRKVMLCIHLDTVFPPEHPFQGVTRVDDDTLRGPGVVDAKGGLAVMLIALSALERSAFAGQIGWEVVLNPDEEIGSPGSADLLTEAATRNQFGLVFEPALPDGALVGARKGSGNFTFIVRGRAAHAGRDFHLGRSAIVAMAELITRVDGCCGGLSGVTINCGQVEGGGAVNIVPELAIARFNIRISTPEQQQIVQTRIGEIAQQVMAGRAVSIELHGGFHSPPKPLDAGSSALIDLVKTCGRELGLALQVRPSGGTCDGNRLAAAGLPVVDTLGPRGGNLHSDQEYVSISSLPERAKMVYLVLYKLALGLPPIA